MTRTLARLMICAILAWPAQAGAGNPTPYPGTNVYRTDYPYAELVKRLTTAIRENRMGIVARASATRGAQSIGIEIPGNTVIMVFRPDYAVRMLRASIPAGIEAPLRYYVTEDPGGKATLVYRSPSSVFRPYRSKALNELAVELDQVFAKIANEAVAKE